MIHQETERTTATREAGSLRMVLMGACAAGAIVIAMPRGAYADCDIEEPDSDQTVTCDTSPPNPADFGVFGSVEVTGVDVNVLTGAEIPFIDLLGGAGDIVIDGAVNGAGGLGPTILLDDPSDGVAQTVGSFINNGLVTGPNNGFQAGVVGEFLNTGTIDAGAAAVQVSDGFGSFTNASGGAITGGGFAAVNGNFSTSQTGSFVNAGDITATAVDGTGVFLGAVDMFVNQSGGVITGGGLGVIIADGDVFINEAGATITSLGTQPLNEGPSFFNDGVIIGSASLIQNDGVIETLNTDGTNFAAGLIADAFDDDGGVIGDLVNTGRITGANVGVNALTRIDSVTNSGLIEGIGGGLTVSGLIRTGADFSGTETVSDVMVLDSLVNDAGGTISGELLSGVAMNGAVGDIDNAGLIEGGEIGVDVGALTNGSGGVMAGSGALGSLTNAAGGIIRGADGFGVFVAAEAEEIVNDGLIEGGQAGVQTGTLASLINDENGIIRGTNDPSNGVLVFGDLGALENAGLIEGLNGVGLAVNGDLIDGANIGIIRALDPATGTPSDISAGLSAGSIGTFVNAGTIEGGATGLGVFGAGLEDGRIGSLTNEASGIIRGRTTGIFGDDLADAIVNAGLIEALDDGGVAIDFEGGDDTLTLVAGGSFGDDFVLGGAGVDTLILQGSGENAIVNLSQFLDFEALEFAPGANFAFTGASDFAITLTEGSTLSGSATIGSLTAGAGSTVAPGSSIGTIDVTGDVTFLPGSTFAVDVEPVEGGLASDRIVAGGVVDVQGGTLAVNAAELAGLGVDFLNGQSLEIVSAEGGVTAGSAFDAITGGTDILEFGASFGPNAIFLDVSAIDLAQVGGTANETATGTALDEAAADSPEVAAVAGAVAATAAADPVAGARALQTLSGQPHAEATQASAQAAQQSESSNGGGGVAGAVGGTVAAGLGDSPFSAFIGPVFTFGGEDSGAESGYDVTNRGFGGGLDYDFKNGIFGGVTFGYSRFRAESTEGLGETTSNNVTVGARTAFANNKWSLKASGSYTFLLGLQSRRFIEIGDQTLTAEADIDAFTVAGSASAAYDFDPQAFAKNAIFSPFTFVNYVRFERDGFTETGASGEDLIVNGVNFGDFDANLAVDGETFNSALLGGGLNTRWRIEGRRLGYGPSLLLGVSYEAGDDQGVSSQQFAAASDGVGELAPNAEERNRLFGRAGIGLILSPKFLDGGFGFAYEAQIDADQVQHIVGFRATQTF